MNWSYTRLRGNLSTKTWGFAPPQSELDGKGVLEKDYFAVEARIALCVLKEVRTIKQVAHLLAKHEESFSLILPVLKLAVEGNMDYKDVKLGKRCAFHTLKSLCFFICPCLNYSVVFVKSSSVRSRRTKNAYQPEDSSITSGSKRKSPNKKQLSSVKKRAPKITPETKSSGLQQPDEHVSPSFHMSQTQAVEVPPSYSKKGGPLTGYSEKLFVLISFFIRTLSIYLSCRHWLTFFRLLLLRNRSQLSDRRQNQKAWRESCRS